MLLRPPFKLDTWLLWGGPALILLLGAFGGWRAICAGAWPRRRVSPDEQRRLSTHSEAGGAVSIGLVRDAR